MKSGQQHEGTIYTRHQFKPRLLQSQPPPFPRCQKFPGYKQKALSSVGVEVHGYHISPLIRREKVISNNDITIVDVDSHRNSVLVNDIPLTIISNLRTIDPLLETGMMTTYSSNLPWQ